MKSEGAEALARRALVESGLRLAKAGLVARSWGNLSLRLSPRAMAVTPSGIPYADLREDMIVVVDLETGGWEGDWKPTSERKIHREIYRRRPEVGAIVHTHQNAASACAAARVAVEAPWGQVPCAPYALPGTKKLTRGAVEALGGGQAVLMANHGAVVARETMDQAFETILALEAACADRLAAGAPAGLSTRADAPWDPLWLTPSQAADGGPGVLSRAPYTLAWAGAKGRKVAYLDDFAQLVGPEASWARNSAGAPYPGRAAARVVLVPGEGAYIAGDDIEATAMVVEKNARAAILGAGLGGAAAIPGWEAQLMRFVYLRSYAKRAVAARTPRR